MQKTLLRLLKRSFGVADAAELEAMITQRGTASEKSDPTTDRLTSGLREFLTLCGNSFDQYERDLDLRSRALEISSNELSDANEKLRRSLASHEEALRSLRQTLKNLRPDIDGNWSQTLPGNQDVATLSSLVSSLVAKSEHDRHELSNQKFALDQHAIVSITDTAGTILYANDRFCAISGYPREELIGQNHRIIKSGIHPPELYRNLWQAISRGEVWHGEICNCARSGFKYWVSASIVPLLNARGIPERYIAISTDITDRKRIEEQLSDQLHLVEALIEAIPLPIYLKDTEGRYLRLNRAFETFFHVQRANVIGQTLHDLLPTDDARVHTEMDTKLFSDQGTQIYEAVVHSRDGVAHQTMYHKTLLHRRDGTVSGLLGIIVDITARKQAEIEIVRAKDAAEAANRAKSQFLANMSHEIRTPMNGVIGMTDLALGTMLTAEQREYLNIAKSSAESLLTIINDILDFSKIEAGKLHIESVRFDLQRLVADTLKPMSLRASEKGVVLISDVQSDVPQIVVGDPSRLRQVLVNLVGNAIKFTNIGEIALHIERVRGNDAMIHFSVRDTGIGIAQDSQAFIFDAFTQEDTSTTRRFGGTGLGLSICRRLVGLMGGNIWLESEAGKGSTFHFTVHLEQATTGFPAQANNSPHLHDRHILIIDQNSAHRNILRNMLTALGTHPHECENGAEALNQLRGGERFDCIFLDAQLPDIDGYALIKHLRAIQPDLAPVLMLSGLQPDDWDRSEEYGIARFLSKPLAAEELQAALKQLFSQGPASSTTPISRLKASHSEHAICNALNILLVEDNPTNQKLALSVLEKWGHKTTLASNGQEALDICKVHDFDLILMDVQMPVMGGIDATREIRHREFIEQRPRTPIIAMTAAAMQDDRAACIAAGMDDYLSKPIKLAELREKLAAHCRTS